MYITSPNLSLLKEIGLSGQAGYIATAYYSSRALEYLNSITKVRHLHLFFRLDLTKNDEWKRRSIDPAALLLFIQKQTKQGATVKLVTHPSAHAKIYIGDKGVICGSSNLSTNGFGSGMEVVCFDRKDGIPGALKNLAQYAKRMEPLDIRTLAKYVQDMKPAKFEEKTDQNKLPRNISYGGILEQAYENFRVWLSKQKGAAEQEIFSRAMNMRHQNLTGHIHKNFFGLRQFYIAYPELIQPLSSVDANQYKLLKDNAISNLIKIFVTHNATDEGSFKVQVWKTYLPIKLGGRAQKDGGTIGNLNRMIPLVAKYLLELSAPKYNR